MPKIPLSVVIIAKNEEKNIEECLKSVHGWADEMVVVDDESTDRTVEIAKSLGAKVCSRRMDNEGKHRNWAYTQAVNEWVLSLDADERVTPELREEITATIPNAEHPTYTIPRRNYIGNYWVKFGGQYPAAQRRLFKKGFFRYEEVGVHPRLFVEGGHKGHLTKDMIHYSYRDFEHFLKKLNSQTDLEAQKWIQTNRKVTFGKAFWRTVDRFFRAFLRKKGHKDGFIGFMFAYFASLYQIISYAKYWERKRGNIVTSHHDQPAPPIKPYTGNKPALSVLIMTKNEEDNIEHCLRSIHGWADEIVVIDDGSTDRTREIAAKYTDRIVHEKWINEGIHRNKCIMQAKNDWIMFLDADEMVTDELRYEIAEELRKGEYDSYSLPLQTYIGKTWVRHSGWYPAHKLRIMDRRKQWFKEEEVHPPPANFVTCKKLKGDVYHKGYPGFEHFLFSLNRQTTLEARKWIKDQRKMSFPLIGWKTTDRFFRVLIGKQAFRDGFIGFMIASFASIYQMMSYAKYWELKNKNVVVEKFEPLLVKP